MKKAFYRVFLICFVVLLACSLSACEEVETNVYMYSSIQECNAITYVKAEDAVVTIYEDSSQDKYIEGIDYAAYFGCKYYSETMQFELFAYEFSDEDAAGTYFKNVTGKKNTSQKNYSDNTGIATYRRIALQDNKVYVVRSPKKDAVEVCEFINQIFSNQIF